MIAPSTEDAFEYPPTALYIYPDYFGATPTSNLEAMTSHITSCNLAFARDGTIHPDSIKDIFGTEEAQFLVNVYDRTPSVAEWYYTLYGIPSTVDDSAYNRAPNPVVDVVMPKGSPPVLGPVLAVLNGPIEGIWEVAETIDEERFARSIWWYLKSGNDVRQVFGEREFLRFIKTCL